MQTQPRYKKGDKIGERYLVYQALIGGMGEVYLCLDLQKNRPYALKTFQARYLTNLKLREAFKREVATWVALEKHPNIVRCFYMDIIDNQPFMFLEWIASDESRGTDLRSWLRHGPLDLRLALNFAIDICRGLIHADQKKPGIVHRDLKPENILVAEGRIAQITDWGLAKIVQEAELEITTTRSEPSRRQSLLGADGIVGTPPYMAPEQWRGEELDGRTDIYAIGCILYEMLMGRPPFFAATFDGLRRQHLEAAIPSLTIGDVVPAALQNLLFRCLAKKRNERFTTVDELLQLLLLIYQQHFSEALRATETGGEFTAEDYSNRGATYAQLRRYDEALADLNRAIQLDATFARAYINRSGVYADRQRYDEAMADCTRAIQLDLTSATAYTNRGRIYQEVQRYREALADHSRAIEINPNYAAALINRGSTYRSLQCYDEALADYTHAIESDPTYAPAYINRGNLYLELQRFNDAINDFEQAIRFGLTEAKGYIGRGIVYENLHRYENALSDFNYATKLDPTSAEAHYNRGIVNDKLGRYDEALKDYTRVIELDVNYGKAYSNRGIIHSILQHNEEALADFTRVIQLDPSNAKVYYNVGTLLFNQGELRKALQHFEKAAELGLSQGVQYAELLKKILR